MKPHEIRRFKIRRRHLSKELEKVLYGKDAQIGADGSIVSDGDDVYLLDAPFQDRVAKISYFCGYHFDVPCAQVRNGYEEYYSLAMNMVQLGWWGNAVHCITVLQRKWRNRRWRLCVQPGLIQLAKDMLEPIYKTSRSLRHTFKHRQQWPAKQQNSRSGVLVSDSKGVVR